MGAEAPPQRPHRREKAHTAAAGVLFGDALDDGHERRRRDGERDALEDAHRHEGGDAPDDPVRVEGGRAPEHPGFEEGLAEPDVVRETAHRHLEDRANDPEQREEDPDLEFGRDRDAENCGREEGIGQPGEQRCEQRDDQPRPERGDGLGAREGEQVPRDALSDQCAPETASDPHFVAVFGSRRLTILEGAAYAGAPPRYACDPPARIRGHGPR